MDVFQVFHSRIFAIIEILAKKNSIDLANIKNKIFVVDSPKEDSHGDIYTNVGMVLAKEFKLKPIELGQKIKDILIQDNDVEKVEIVGAGFINIFLKKSYLQNVLKEALKLKDNFAKIDIGKGKVVNIEYVSANPTGPLHIGHGRGAVVGDILANLYNFLGFKVVKEYYINDAGGQVNVLGKSLYFRYLELQGKEQDFDLGEGFYPGNYLIETAKKILDKDGDKWVAEQLENCLPYFKEFALNDMMNLIKEDLEVLGINHEIFSSEKGIATDEAYNNLIRFLDKKGLIYMGKLNPPKGKQIDDFEPRIQKLYRATTFGDDTDRPLEKSNGERTYFANDIVYHFDKIKRGGTKLINIWGADHVGYVKRMVSAVKAISDNNASLDVVICQLVNLMEGGVPVKMSKRAGTFITLRDLIQEVGKDICRFIMISRKNDVALDFDLLKAKEHSASNPVYYIQYAYARICSVLRNVKKEENIDIYNVDINTIDFSMLTDESEIDLIKIIFKMPKYLQGALYNNDPHKIYIFLMEVAKGFHSLWNKGKQNNDLRFIIKNNQNLTIARLSLLLMVSTAVKCGMDILGVSIKDSM